MIILKKKYLDFFIKKKNHFDTIKTISSLNYDELINEMNETLDLLNELNKIESTIEDNDEINENDYYNYIELLQNEEYEKLKDYKIIN